MFQKLLENIASALDERNLPYMVIGGQAVLLYGEPRLPDAPKNGSFDRKEP